MLYRQILLLSLEITNSLLLFWLVLIQRGRVHRCNNAVILWVQDWGNVNGDWCWVKQWLWIIWVLMWWMWSPAVRDLGIFDWKLVVIIQWWLFSWSISFSPRRGGLITIIFASATIRAVSPIIIALSCSSEAWLYNLYQLNCLEAANQILGVLIDWVHCQQASNHCVTGFNASSHERIL